MTTEADLIRLLADAQRAGTRSVEATMFGDLDRAAAYRELIATQATLGQTTGMLKTGIHADGVGIVAPIYAVRVGRSSAFSIPSGPVTGLEVEVGLVLARAIPSDPSVDEATVASAVDHYFTGVEICSSRYIDRSKATPPVALADNVSAYGYAIGRPFARGTDIDGLAVTIDFAGKQIYSAPAKHGFGTVVASLVAYARSQRPEYPLAAGTVVTTGSLCGLVPTSGPGHVVAKLGGETIELDLV